MKQLILILILTMALIFDKRLPHQYTIYENEPIVGTSTTIAMNSITHAEHKRKFERAFEQYAKCSDLLSEQYHGTLNTVYSLENLMELYEHYCDEAVNLLPDDFIEEIERLKLQIQAK